MLIEHVDKKMENLIKKFGNYYNKKYYKNKADQEEFLKYKNTNQLERNSDNYINATADANKKSASQLK